MKANIRKPLLIGVFLFFSTTKAITPIHLANIFDEVHELSFTCKYNPTGMTLSPNLFLEICKKMCPNEDVFLANFGVRDDQAGHEALKMAFNIFKNILLLPKQEPGTFSTHTIPITMTTFIALESAEKTFIELTKKPNKPSFDVQNEEFDLSKTPLEEVFNNFAKKMQIAIEKINAEAINRSKDIKASKKSDGQKDTSE